jgi:hypothetical protein
VSGNHSYALVFQEEDSNEEEEADEDDDTDANSKLSKKSSSKADKLRQLAKTFCLGMFRTPVAPSDDATEDASDTEDGHSSEHDSLEPADRRIFLTVVASEHVKVRDYLAGSNPYLIVKPDGRGGRRPTQRSKTEWLAPNTQFNESFELDITESDLPVRLVIWDHLEELTSSRDLKRAAKELLAANRPEVPPSEAYMRYVDVPDFDHPPGPELDPKRKRALPRFVEIPESRTPTTAWFPVQEPPLTMAGDDAFDNANKRATGKYDRESAVVETRLVYSMLRFIGIVSLFSDWSGNFDNDLIGNQLHYLVLIWLLCDHHGSNDLRLTRAPPYPPLSLFPPYRGLRANGGPHHQPVLPAH